VIIHTTISDPIRLIISEITVVQTAAIIPNWGMNMILSIILQNADMSKIIRYIFCFPIAAKIYPAGHRRADIMNTKDKIDKISG
jgi:hypothetical protein